VSARAPDVTVVTAVYNTMPYLTRTLASLVAQSIGLDRLEVVAVDDGSTDGSGEELDRFAERHPDVVKVIHQPNSGGPAGPSNRGIEAATGRYVYFLGADDYLAPEALERLVGYADQHGSDVVIGKVVGANGRHIAQRLFGRNQPDLPVYGPDLRWAMANTNLYRRDLLDRTGLRYVEGLPFGSDQPFMVEACVNARKVSVLADYTCYYAVAREERRNISFATRYDERLRCITVLMETVERVVEAGEKRDTILVRHFTWEVPSLLRQGFAELPDSDRERVCADVAALVRRFGAPRVMAELRVPPRVLLHLAQRGDADSLAAMIGRGEGVEPPLRVLAEGVYAGYPGLDADDPAAAYAVPDDQGLRDRLTQGLRLVRASFEGRGGARRLVLELESNLVDPAGRATVEAWLRGGPAGRDRVPLQGLRVHRDGVRTRLVGTVDVPDLEATGADGAPWTVRLKVSAAGLSAVLAVPPDGDVKVRFRHGAAMRVVWLDHTDPAQRPRALAVRVNDVPVIQAALAARRRVARRVAQAPRRLRRP
jgi:glycosyltransferase involved in cell wall biosynthesis